MTGSLGRSGHGASIVFGTTGWTGIIHKITGLHRTRGKIEITALNLAVNSEKQYIPEDLIDCDEITIDYEFNPSASTQTPLTSAPETITITAPMRSGESTAATLAGSGFATDDKHGDYERGSSNPMMGQLKFQFDGLTGPVLTAGSA